MSAQFWFDILMTEYLEKHAHGKGRKEAAMRQYRALREQGKPADLRVLKQQFKGNLRRVVRDYFEAYFAYSVLPQNQSRFEPLWLAYEAKVATAIAR
jgi:hypothetical protein